GNSALLAGRVATLRKRRTALLTRYAHRTTSAAPRLAGAAHADFGVAIAALIPATKRLHAVPTYPLEAGVVVRRAAIGAAAADPLKRTDEFSTGRSYDAVPVVAGLRDRSTSHRERAGGCG